MRDVLCPPIPLSLSKTVILLYWGAQSNLKQPTDMKTRVLLTLCWLWLSSWNLGVFSQSNFCLEAKALWSALEDNHLQPAIWDVEFAEHWWQEASKRLDPYGIYLTQADLDTYSPAQFFAPSQWDQLACDHFNGFFSTYQKRLTALDAYLAETSTKAYEPELELDL